MVGGIEVAEGRALRGQVLALLLIPDSELIPSSGGRVPRDDRVNAAPAVVCALTSLFIFLNFSFLILNVANNTSYLTG